jgi:NAD(P)-dependent dehydrogenase (short-subunit alcohol dehydrogenase family)
MRSIVITGVSTGIGLASAQRLIDAGFRVYGSVRKQADADRVASQLGDAFTPLLFDVTDREAVDRAASEVGAELGDGTLAGLVNNAGIAVSGPLLYLDPAEMRRQLEVNLLGVLHVTQAFAPLLGVDDKRIGHPGRIVNISSVAGQRALPFLGPYAASKHALEGFSEALRRELLLFGIDVIVIGPGPVRTAIWDKADESDMSAFSETPYAPMIERFSGLFVAQGKKGLPASDLGELVFQALTLKKPKVRYTAMQAGLVERLVTRFAPKRQLDHMIAKAFGLLPGK